MYVDLLKYCHENGVRTETILCHALFGFGRAAVFGSQSHVSCRECDLCFPHPSHLRFAFFCKSNIMVLIESIFLDILPTFQIFVDV